MLHRTLKAAAAATCALFLLGCGGGSAVEMESAALDATGLLKPLAVAASDLQDWEASDTQAVDASGLQQVALGQGAQSSQSTGSAGSGTAPSQPAQPQLPASPSSPSSQDAGGQDTHAVDIGMNLPQLSYWDRSFAMADVVRQSQFRGSDWSEDVNADATGAPGQDFKLIFNSRMIGAGTYKLVFTGKADVTLGGMTGSVQNKKYDAAANRTTADVVLPVSNTGNTWLTFSNTRRTASSIKSDGVTQVQMWRPGYPTDGSVTFTKEFLNAMRKVQVLRAMDMTATNDNANEKWADRTLPNFIGMTKSRGQSWELLIALANAAERDLWINVPVKADDDYIRKLAQLFRYGSDGVQPYTSMQVKPTYAPLRSDLKLYVEYGNEIWNSSAGFYGFRWVKPLADAARTDLAHPINHNGAVTDEWLGFRRYIAYRSAFISQKFRDIWGDVAMMTQVRPIFATQVGNANSYLREGLTWAEEYYGDVSRLWWGAGGASYYGAIIDSTDLSESKKASYFSVGAYKETELQRIRTDSIWTKAFGLRNVAYEGGPAPGGSELGSVSATETASTTYNNDPRMAKFMANAYDLWKANGGDLLVYYNYSGMGAPWWFIDGTKDLIESDTTSVKMKFLDSLSARPVALVTLGRKVPMNIYAGDSDTFIQSANSALDGSGDDMRFRMRYENTYQGVTTYPKSMLLVPVRADQAGNRMLKLILRDSGATTKIRVWLNGHPIGLIEPGVVDGKNRPLTTIGLPLTLPRGLSVLRFQSVAGEGSNIRNIIVE